MKGRLTEHELESILAGLVRSYLHSAHDADSAWEDKLLGDICSIAAGLLGALLEGHAEWNGWIDSIIPATDMIPEAIEIVSDVELRLRGRVIWAKSVGALGVWIEPFFFSVRLSDTDDLVAAYVFSFADAARGLEKVLYGMRLRRPDWFFPAEWLFTFQR